MVQDLDPKEDGVARQDLRNWPTGMREHVGEPWKVLADGVHEQVSDCCDAGYRMAEGNTAVCEACGLPCGLFRRTSGRQEHATLRRVGWLDQKGRVWLATPPAAMFGGGSLTPLLIDARED